MTFTEIITAIGAVGAVVGAVAFIADMKDEGRSRLKRWAVVSYRVAHFVYALTALVIGAAGIAIFYFYPEPATRRDIVHMLIFVLDIAIGCWRFSAMAETFGKDRKTAGTLPAAM